MYMPSYAFEAMGLIFVRISSYLSNNNVQMGASYAIGQKSTNLFSEGCKAGARYINAQPDEVGKAFHHLPSQSQA
jgi:hypothetical protein